ncbi:transporter [Pseudomonas sp. MOB-449]|nr:transporter [Pseudomonas sp. MOB-449]
MRTACVILPGLLVCLASPVLADEFTVSSGFDYSRGKYGTPTISETWYVPVIAKYETGPMIYKLTIPYLRITNPSVGPDGEPLPGDCDSIESGLGDTVASADYLVLDGTQGGGLMVDLIGKVKLPTANEDHCLGTGKTDYSAQVDLTQAFGAVSAFATLGWKKFGDPADSDFRDPIFTSLGLVGRLAPGTSVGAVYDWRQKVSSDGAETQEFTLFLTQRLSPTWKAQLYALKGFSDASPDSGGGLMLSHSF